jgi:hypothetical protein
MAGATLPDAIAAWNRRVPAIGEGSRVEVKPLEWEEYWVGHGEDIPAWRGRGPLGLYVGFSFAGKYKIEKHADAPADEVAAEKADCEARYRDRVLSALSSAPTPAQEGRDAPEPVGYVSEWHLNEVREGRIGNIFPAGVLRPENETPVFAASPPSDAELVRMREALEAILLCHKEGGLLDSVDNDGEHYTSQALIDAIAKGRAALSAKEGQ